MTQANIVISASDKTKAAFNSVQDNLGKVSGALTSTTAKIGGLIGVGGFGAFLTVSARAKLESKGFADALKMSNQEMLAYGYALEGTGISTEKFADQAKDMAEKLADAAANGGGEAADVVKRLGLNIDELVKMRPDQQLLSIAGALDQVGTQAEKVQIMESLASDASLLLPLLEDNGSELRRLTDEAKSTGAAITDIDAEKLQMADVSMARSASIMSGVGARIAAQLAPYIEATARWFTRLSVEHNGFTAEIIDSAERIAGAIAFLGDMWRGLEAVWTGLEVVFWAGVKTQMTGLGMLGKAIEDVLNLMPGVELKGSRFFDNIAAHAEEKMTASINRLDELVMASMPSEKIKAAFNEIRAEMDATAAKSVEIKLTVPTDTGQITPNNAQTDEAKKQQEALEKLRTQQQEKYAVLIEGFAGESELTYLHEAQKAADLQMWRDNGSISEEQYQTGLTLIEQEGANARKRIAENERKSRMAVTEGMLGNLTALMASGSKEQFEIGKTASLAMATIKGYEAITSSYAAGAKVGGPWLGAAYAATAAIATAAQISQLSSQQFSGGGSISPAGGGGVSAGGGQPYVAPVPPALSGTTAQRGNGGTTTINLVGDETSIYSYNQVQAMMSGIREALANGDEVIIPAGSRQAQELVA